MNRRPTHLVVLIAGALASGLVACEPGVTANPYGPYRNRNAAIEAMNELSHEERAAFGGLSPEDQAWAAQHPQAARELGRLSPEEREGLRQQFESLPPEMKQRVRENPEAFMP